jgi:hypothetical protein
MVDLKTEELVQAYLYARNAVVAAGFLDEIQYHESLCFDWVKESDFLREAAWVILCSGTSEAVIRRKFPHITHAFLDWRSAQSIVENRNRSRAAALVLYAHAGKIDAILEIASAIARDGFPFIRASIKRSGVDYLRHFSYLGPATSFHLAKNIGLNVVKPDRHLVRISSVFGYDSPREMCQKISAAIGDRVPVVDTVFWRYATIERMYTSRFRELLNQGAPSVATLISADARGAVP